MGPFALADGGSAAMLKHTALALLLLVTIGVYAPLLRTGHTQFVYEDALTLQTNPMVRGFQPISLSTPRWLTWTSYRIDAWRGGETAQFHATSLALHLIVALLIYGLLGRWHAPDPWRLFAVGAICLHPLTVESVAYLSARSELIFAIGVLLALWCAPVGDEDWTGVRLIGLVLSTYVAIGGKELGIVAPVLASLVRPLPRRIWPILALLMVVALYRLFDHHTAVNASPYGVGESIVLQLVAVTRGLRLLIWPTGLTVDADIARASFLGRCGAVGLVGLLALFVWNARADPTVAWIGAWLTLTVGPRVVAHSWEWMNEHQWYVPLIGIVLAVGVGSRAVRLPVRDLGPIWLGPGDRLW